MLMIKKITEFQAELIHNKNTTSLMKQEVIKEINKFIQEEVYDMFQHNNKNPLDFYLIKENQVDIRMSEYKIMKEYKQNNFYNNKIIVIRAQITNIFSIKHNRLIGGVTFCNSFLQCFEEVFCLTQDLIITKFWSTSNLHLYNEREMKYDIFNKIKKTQKTELDLKLSEIRFQGAMFYVDRYNLPLAFSDENFYSLSGGMWLMDSFIYLKDKSLGPIIFTKENIEEVAIKDDIKFLMIFIFFKEIDKLPLSGAVTGEFLILLNSNHIKSNKHLILNYFKNNYSAGRIEGENYTYNKVVNYISSFNEFNVDYEKNYQNLEKIRKNVLKYNEYEYYLIKNKFKFLHFEEFQKIKENEKNLNEKKENKIKLIPILGMVNSNIEFFTESLSEYIKRNSKFNCVVLRLLKSQLTNIQNITNLFKQINQTKEKSKETIYILELQIELPIFQIVEIFATLIENFWNNYEIINFCYSVNYLCFVKNENKAMFFNIKTCLNTDICQVLFIDEAEVTSRKKDLLSIQIRTKSQVFNKRSFLMGSKDLNSIYTESRFSRKVYDLVLKNNLYFMMDISQINNDQLFIPFNYRVIQELFEDFLRHNLCRPFFIKNLIEDTNQDHNLKTVEKKGKLIMTDIEFQDQLISLVKDVKDPNYFIIEKIYGVQKFQNNDNLLIIKANYKLLDYQKVKAIDSSDIGFLLTGKNVGKYKEIINNMLFDLCGGKIPNHLPYLSGDTISEEEKDRLNLIHLEDEIPEDWDRDGLIFIDKNDNRSAYHPRINEFINKFIEEKNNDIAEKNKVVDQEIKQFYLIN